MIHNDPILTGIRITMRRLNIIFISLILLSVLLFFLKFKIIYFIIPLAFAILVRYLFIKPVKSFYMQHLFGYAKKQHFRMSNINQETKPRD